MQNIWYLADVVFMETVVCHQLWSVITFSLLHSAGHALCVSMRGTLRTQATELNQKAGITF